MRPFPWIKLCTINQLQISHKAKHHGETLFKQHRPLIQRALIIAFDIYSYCSIKFWFQTTYLCLIHGFLCLHPVIPKHLYINKWKWECKLYLMILFVTIIDHHSKLTCFTSSSCCTKITVIKTSRTSTYTPRTCSIGCTFSCLGTSNTRLFNWKTNKELF